MAYGHHGRMELAIGQTSRPPCRLMRVDGVLRVHGYSPSGPQGLGVGGGAGCLASKLAWGCVGHGPTVFRLRGSAEDQAEYTPHPRPLSNSPFSSETSNFLRKSAGSRPWGFLINSFLGAVWDPRSVLNLISLRFYSFLAVLI